MKESNEMPERIYANDANHWHKFAGEHGTVEYVRGLHWSTDEPNREGYYWQRPLNGAEYSPRVVRIGVGALTPYRGFSVEIAGYGVYYIPDFRTHKACEWAGPIALPSEAV